MKKLCRIGQLKDGRIYYKGVPKRVAELMLCAIFQGHSEFFKLRGRKQE